MFRSEEYSDAAIIWTFDRTWAESDIARRCYSGPGAVARVILDHTPDMSVLQFVEDCIKFPGIVKVSADALVSRNVAHRAQLRVPFHTKLVWGSGLIKQEAT